MDNNSLAHTKWNCKYHIVFVPKYRIWKNKERYRENIKKFVRIQVSRNNRGKCL